MQVHSFNPKHCARQIQVRTEFKKKQTNTWSKYTLPYSSPEPYYATSVRVFARHAAQNASERQATSQWKSTHECRAETPEETETRNGSSAIRHFERGGDEDLTE